MTTREQTRHLLRRFGFGGSLAELAIYEPLGVEGAAARLIDYETVDENFPISPWEICFEPDKPDIYLDPPRIGVWWALRMLLTHRPMQENLTLFWHNHFAVSAQKLEFGPAMLQYIDALRQNANGAFPELLKAVSTTPAMVKWLDTDASMKGHPNENFARELMELFTLGVGNYTEADVKEAARAFTGWGLRYLVFESGGENVQRVAKDSVRTGLPMVAFCVTPDLHDDGAKSVLGKTGKLDGLDVLKEVADRPETARRISRKLWEWYAYPEPEAAVVDKLASTFRNGGGQLKPVLHEIATMPEFWSAKCIRQKVKSPADFVLGIVRQLDLQPMLLGMRFPTAKSDTPLTPQLRGVGGMLWGLMMQQGLQLLYPPDVGGWHWGKAWLTSANMTQRMNFGNLIFGVSQPDKGMAAYVANRIATERKPTKAEEVVEALLDMFDAEFEKEKLALLVKACEDNGGVSALGKPETASPMLAAVCRLVFSSPEFQMC